MKTPITVRVDSELLADARRCAREENRTLTNFIETVLRQRVVDSGAKAATRVRRPSAVEHRSKPTHAA